ncbi:MAG: SDR family NAD(P)-dependent oxidoreductase [Dehalococcoidales bacterium]|nr:SDR family NAD(P)-dependent oxidoreductase [Dehalococcoidales bacterium]
MEFKDKVAVITGGASGIGRSVAMALAKEGADIVIADMNDSRLEEARQQIQDTGRRVLTVHCDVSNYADVEKLAAQTIATMGKADILMNNAGVVVRGWLENLSMADWEWAIGINLLGVIRGVQAFLPYMLKQGSGYIINTASGAGFLITDPKNISYSTCKFGVVGLSEGLFAYLRPKGIMVSVLCPAEVRTNLISNSRYVGTEDEIKEMRQMGKMAYEIPREGLMEPDELAQKVIEAMKQKRFIISTHEQLKDILMNQGLDIQKLEKHFQDTYK